MSSQHPTTPEEILRETLRREEEAYHFYGHLAAGCQIVFIKELLERLKDEEYKHVEMIQRLITKLNLGEELV
jgi:rubrerythrin